MEFSKLLSLSGTAMPKHLRGNPGGCLAVVIQALEWRMSPISVANQSIRSQRQDGLYEPAYSWRGGSPCATEAAPPVFL
jgi:hypothetical protein